MTSFPMKWRTDTTSAPPWGNRLILTDLPNGFEDPWVAIPGGNIFPYKINARRDICVPLDCS